ncbi:MAG: hypothetical protein CMJ83_22020 [Planctomycetes bacterium]|nr:hypothetical protein [Planctomycetota bacterium]
MPPDLTETRPRAAPRLNTGKHRKAQLDITSLRACVKMFQMREHRLPTESDWPGFLTQGSQNHPDPYLDPQRHPGGKILDPWGNSYVYRRTSSRDFEIRSLGADGKKGGTGANADISSKKQQRRK